MSRRARCADCDVEVLPSSAATVIRASGIVMLCTSCHAPPAVATGKRRKAVVRQSTQVGVAPAPTPTPAAVLLSAPPTGQAADEEEDYDALYVSVEEDEDEDYDAVFISPGPATTGTAEGQSSELEGVIAGTDYASAAGSFEVQSSRGPRQDTTPPPAVVITNK